MKSILDPSFEYTSSVDTDIRKTFDRVRREISARDDDNNGLALDCNSIWLECNGDLVDFSSVKVARVRGSAFDAEIVEFVCPQCKQLHESLRFG
jgi:hypothetical protein